MSKFPNQYRLLIFVLFVFFGVFILMWRMEVEVLSRGLFDAIQITGRRSFSLTANSVYYDSLSNNRRKEVKAKTDENLNHEIDKLLVAGYNYTKPRIIFLVSTWRSGSSFLGELLASVPGSWYHYEPLMYLGFSVYKSLPREEVTALLRNLINCNFGSDLVVNKYLNVTMSRHQADMIQLNTKYYQDCLLGGSNSHLCFEPDVLSYVCTKSPIQVFKTVRMPLLYTDDLKPSLTAANFNVILLVRDPRAVIASRKATEWEKGHLWTNSKTVCNEYILNYKMVERLKKTINITVLRYEDLSQNVTGESRKLFEELALPLTSDTEKFIQDHTSGNAGGPHSTYRDPVSRITTWTQGRLSWNEVEHIQKHCEEAMGAYGYKMLTKDEFDIAQNTTTNELYPKTDWEANGK